MPKDKPVDRGPRAGDVKNRGQEVRPPRLDGTTPTRGSSVQGERQDAKGGPAGANQGGASRGGSRVEPSHTERAAKKDRGKK